MSFTACHTFCPGSYLGVGVQRGSAEWCCQSTAWSRASWIRAQIRELYVYSPRGNCEDQVATLWVVTQPMPDSSSWLSLSVWPLVCGQNPELRLAQCRNISRLGRWIEGACLKQSAEVCHGAWKHRKHDQFLQGYKMCGFSESVYYGEDYGRPGERW